MRLPALVTALALGLVTLPGQASEEVEHYAAEPSGSLAEALDNLAAYNARVQAVMARDSLSVADMEEVHEYTYTMEQAVARIAEDMEAIAVLLEQVHLSSEGDAPQALREAAQAYLDRSAPLTE